MLSTIIWASKMIHRVEHPLKRFQKHFPEKPPTQEDNQRQPTSDTVNLPKNRIEVVGAYMKTIGSSSTDEETRQDGRSPEPALRHAFDTPFAYPGARLLLRMAPFAISASRRTSAWCYWMASSWLAPRWIEHSWSPFFPSDWVLYFCI